MQPVVNRCLTLPPLLQWLREERNLVLTHRLVSRHAGDVVENPFFLGAVAVLNSVDDYMKGCRV
jgi:hypothetical protein